MSWVRIPPEAAFSSGKNASATCTCTCIYLVVSFALPCLVSRTDLIVYTFKSIGGLEEWERGKVKDAQESRGNRVQVEGREGGGEDVRELQEKSEEEWEGQRRVERGECMRRPECVGVHGMEEARRRS